VAVLEQARRDLAALGATLVEFALPEDPTTAATDEKAALSIVGEPAEFHKQWWPARIADYGGVCRDRVLIYYGGSNGITAGGHVRSLRQRAEYVRRWSATFDEHRLDCLLQTALS